MGKTVLGTIGVSNELVKKWHEKGLCMSFPMKENKHYFQSEDGDVFIENGDKYVVPLNKKETRRYTLEPALFRSEFIQNARLYAQYANWLHSLQSKTSKLNVVDKFIAHLTLLYLFQRGMDHHYYHFDRYLAYQKYPKTPVGYWWSRLQKICNVISVFSNIDSNEVLLHLLSNDSESIKLKKLLSKKQQHDLAEVLKSIKLFEKVQEEEIRIMTDFKTKENILFRTAIPLWSEIIELL
ncbi:hypothetical protein HGB07_05800, partial [Candidatus Roizmanbacteria bacterium]|nr:hypothetical protein [Candidatus Roizmanbacteria bacterium]